MATKSFNTDFNFTSKSAEALADAIESSKRVDIETKIPVVEFSNNDKKGLHLQFDKLFLGADEK